VLPRDGQRDLRSRWLAAARDPAIAGALDSVYADLAAAVEARAPVCWASGRCCNFEAHGHRLYVTGLEAAYTLMHLGEFDTPRAAPTAEEIAAARARGGCPFQQGNLCSVHSIKPLGCRIYFCDRSAQAWQHDLSERLLGEIRRIHELHAIPYRYAEWRDMLSLFARARATTGAAPSPSHRLTVSPAQGLSLPLLPPR
jgi:Fe-S-cluster containining protein